LRGLNIPSLISLSSFKTRFFNRLLNNGITIVASHITPGSPEFAIHDPQIVNGLQTSQVIASYFEETKNDPDAETRQAIIRIIKPMDDDVKDRIIRATNSQTKIPLQFLRASDEFQRDLEIRFKASGLHYDRRKNSWRDAGIKLSDVVGLSELAQSIASVILLEPDHARARPSRYFKEDNTYKKAFNPGRPIEEYIACARLKKCADKFVKTVSQNEDIRTDLRFYVLMVVGHPLFRSNRAAFRKLDVATISNQTWIDAWDLAAEIYEKEGGNDTAAKSTRMISVLLERLGLPPRKEPAKRKGPSLALAMLEAAKKD
jgi:hypothetical protein